MTMEFAVADKALLKGLKPGDRVDFEVAARGPNEYVIQRLTHKGH
jgi:Cu/Ag efflux protein CusF